MIRNHIRKIMLLKVKWIFQNLKNTVFEKNLLDGLNHKVYTSEKKDHWTYGKVIRN